MDALILGIITAVITPTATLVGVWLGSRSSLTAQRELMAAQELQRQRDLVVDVVIVARKFLNQQLVVLPQLFGMDRQAVMEWTTTEMGPAQRELRSALDLAIAKATHSLNDKGLSYMVSELGAGLTLDSDLLKKGPGGELIASDRDVIKWYGQTEDLVAQLETGAWAVLRPPDWLTPESLKPKNDH